MIVNFVVVSIALVQLRVSILLLCVLRIFMALSTLIWVMYRTEVTFS